MQESMNKVSQKIDAMEINIRDTIGDAIRESLQAGFSQNLTPPYQPTPTTPTTQGSSTPQSTQPAFLQTHPTSQPQPSPFTHIRNNQDAEMREQGPHSQQTMGAQN